MELTLSMHNSLFQFFGLLYLPSRIFLTHTVQYNHHLLYISLIYRLDGARVFSIRIFNEIKPIFTVFAVQGISSLYIFQFHSTTNISGYQLRHRNTISSGTNKSCAIRSLEPRSALVKSSPSCTFPLITLKYCTPPIWGSTAVLKK